MNELSDEKCESKTGINQQISTQKKTTNGIWQQF